MFSLRYTRYMRGRGWGRRKRRYYAKFQKRCAICGRCNPEVAIQLHHLSYEHLGHELDVELMPLCTAHHLIITQKRGAITSMKWKHNGRTKTVWRA